jgi:hypothetical protein
VFEFAMTYHRIFRPILAAALVVASLAAASVALAAAIGAYTTRGTWKFVSAPNLHPPKLKVLSRKSGLAPGDFLVANLPNASFPFKLVGEGGPMILDKQLRPVWVLGVGTKVGAADLQQESYLAPGTDAPQPVLLWWEGVVNGHGITTKGKVIVVNEHYRKIATIKAAAPWVVSLHDASIVGPDIWVTEYRAVGHQNLKPYGGPRSGTVYDVGLQEYDLATGKPIGGPWDALNPGHTANIPLSASKQPVPHSGAWDAYHLNSVQALPDGNLLMSLRNTEAVYLLNPTTGKAVWTLGGKHSTFTFGSGAKFSWQHDAQLVNTASSGLGPNEELTLFDDNCCKIKANGSLAAPDGPSEGMVLNLDTVTDKATLVAAYRHKPTLHTAFLGSMQVLPNGNALVGFGSLPYFSEYSKSGKQLLNVQWPGSVPRTTGAGKDESYRALYTQSWVGTPYYRPSGTARKASGKTTVYASWNGATEVAKWQVLAGNKASHLKPVASQHRNGFETSIALKKGYAVYEVQALDSHGKVLGQHGTSKPFTG